MSKYSKHIPRMAAILVSTPCATLADGRTAEVIEHMHGWYMHPRGLWWILPLLLAGLLIFLFSRRDSGNGLDASRRGETRSIERRPVEAVSSSSLAILNERFARGEVDKEEYEEKKRAITGVTS